MIRLEDAGMSKFCYDRFSAGIKVPYGIVLVTGPTGSGKTTTLHSILKFINKPETKIWTAEDPVEITQKGLRKVQINKKAGLDFATIMRAFLRADPDVIMVGEIRDLETAQMAIRASLTGHMVFSSLHANSSCQAFERLRKIGIDDLQMASSNLAISAQRLVRKICPHCKAVYKPPINILKRIENYFDEDTEIYKGMKLIDDKLGGTTPLDIIVEFPDIEKSEKTDDDFDSWDDEEKDDAKYWFTSNKIDRITQVHDYLENLEAVGKVLSFASMVRVAEDLNDGKKLQGLEMGILYTKIPNSIKKEIIDPYISIKNTVIKSYFYIIPYFKGTTARTT